MNAIAKRLFSVLGLAMVLSLAAPPLRRATLPDRNNRLKSWIDRPA